MSERKAQFCWASIAGADPEPVELVRIDGRLAIYTCGCADPFFLNDKSVPVRVGRTEIRSQNSDASPVFIEDASLVAISRPLLGDKWQADQDAKIAEKAKLRQARRKSGVVFSHGWRGPR